MSSSTRFAMGALLLGLVAGACADDAGAPRDETTATSSTIGAPITTTGAPRTTGGTDSSTSAASPGGTATTAPGGSPISASDGTLSDGMWKVGDAGIVEFAIAGDGLELVEATANEGWRMSIDEQADDEIEIDFERDNLEYQIEIEYEDGILEIEIDLDIDPAEQGSFEIGPAGEATVVVAGDSVALDDLAVADGWDVVEDDTDDDDVELEFRRDNVKWEFRAEFDDGRLEVELDFEIEGRSP